MIHWHPVLPITSDFAPPKKKNRDFSSLFRLIKTTSLRDFPIKRRIFSIITGIFVENCFCSRTSDENKYFLAECRASRLAWRYDVSARRDASIRRRRFWIDFFRSHVYEGHEHFMVSVNLDLPRIFEKYWVKKVSKFKCFVVCKVFLFLPGTVCQKHGSS